MSLLLLGSGVLAHAAPAVQALGNNTYAITAEARTIFTRNAEKLKAQALEDATKYCASHNLQIKVVSLTEEKPLIGMDFIKAKIVFKALKAGDPELSAALPTVDLAPKATDTPDLYTELIKLDELRKRGLLTDQEFDEQKQKLLKRTR